MASPVQDRNELQLLQSLCEKIGFARSDAGRIELSVAERQAIIWATTLLENNNVLYEVVKRSGK